MPALQLQPETLPLLDLEAAAVAEGGATGGLLPPTLVDQILRTQASEVAGVLRAELRHPVEEAVPEVLSVAKPSRGHRPVAVLGPRQRVLYRALADALGDEVPAPDRGSDAYEAFKRGPLTDSGPAFVVMADIASCYQYIDYEVVQQEIISRTANPFIAEDIVSFLGSQSSQSFGLPQNRAASHRIAELVLKIPERMMLRAGYDVWRYSDDFRIGAGTRAEAHQALEEFEDSLRKVGLTLNDEKTSVRTSELYQLWADAVQDRLIEIQDEAEVDLGVFDYEGNIVELDQSQVLLSSALRLLELWRDDLQHGRNQYGPEAASGRQIVSVALGVAGALRDLGAVEYLADIVDHDPALTSNVARYLDIVRAEDEDSFDSMFDSMLGNADLYLSPWQSLWMMEPLIETSGLTRRQRNWLISLSTSRSDYVSASASRVLAAHGRANADLLMKTFDQLSTASRPIVVEALALQAGGSSDQLLRSLVIEDPLYRWIAATVSLG